MNQADDLVLFFPWKYGIIDLEGNDAIASPFQFAPDLSDVLFKMPDIFMHSCA